MLKKNIETILPNIYNTTCTFNPLNKLMETVEENKKLYEHLLQAEKDKIDYLEKLLKGK
jgi:hypothetical protein